MIVAALDIGSNSIHLLIAQFDHNHLEPIKRYKEKVKLGAGLDADNNLSNHAINRGLKCLNQFVEYLNAYHVEKLFCVATNVIRLANNRQDFLQQAEQILMHPIKVISGDTEADLIWQGVMAERPGYETSLVVDIGGGSTEIAKANPRSRTPQTWSLQMGCVSYTRRFFSDGKIYHETIRAALATSRMALEPIVQEIIPYPDTQVIGTAGTLESISFLSSELFAESDGLIRLDEMDEMLMHLISHGSINELPYLSLDDGRKYILPAGICICKSIMELLDIDTILVARSELCEGVLVANLLNQRT